MKSLKITLKILTLFVTFVFALSAPTSCQPLPSSLSSIRGVFFEPDTASGSSWLVNYTAFSWQRPETITELQELKAKTGLTHVTIFLASARELAYPVPSQANLTNLNLFLSDARDAGFKVLLFLGTPCVVSNSFASSVGEGATHVGGHLAGETMNGYKLFWNVPFCEANNVNVVSGWLLDSLAGIDPNLYSTIESITLGGMHRYAFGAESNYFYSESPYKAIVASYYESIIPSLRISYPDFKYGVSLILSWWKQPQSAIYDQIQYANANIPSADYFDVSAMPQVKMDSLLSYVSFSRVVVSDFKTRSGLSQGIPQSTVFQYWVGQCDMNKVGWWLYGYRDNIHGGLRLPDSQGGTWDERMVSAARASTGLVCQ